MALYELAGYYAAADDIEHAKQSYLQAIRENPDKGSNFEGALVGSLAGVCIKNGAERGRFRDAL